jgi:hypothetical protein
MRTAKQIGDAWEKKIAKMFGGRITPGSGNTWTQKLDVRMGRFLVSAKATEAASFTVTDDMIREMNSYRNRPGGVGPEVIPVLMVKTANQEVVVMNLIDFSAMSDAETVEKVRPDLKLVHSHEARKPQILRD